MAWSATEVMKCPQGSRQLWLQRTWESAKAPEKTCLGPNQDWKEKDSKEEKGEAKPQKTSEKKKLADSAELRGCPSLGDHGVGMVLGKAKYIISLREHYSILLLSWSVRGVVFLTSWLTGPTGSTLKEGNSSLKSSNLWSASKYNVSTQGQRCSILLNKLLRSGKAET